MPNALKMAARARADEASRAAVESIRNARAESPAPPPRPCAKPGCREQAAQHFDTCMDHTFDQLGGE